MKQHLLALLWTLAVAIVPLRAEQILRDLNFDDGSWAMIAIPIANYNPHPMQDEMRTFISQDILLMKKIQKEWDLKHYYFDGCDDHYALKFYQDGELQTTLKINLNCRYLQALDFSSYEFNPEQFEQFKATSRAISWSRIRFGNQDALTRAIELLDRSGGVYWMDNVPKMYRYSGYFMMEYMNMPWNADVDSLRLRTEVALEMAAGDTTYYLEEYISELLQDDMQLRVVYRVHCNPDFAQRVTLPNKYLNWRSHWAGKDSLSIVAIGLSEAQYKRMMREAYGED